MTTVRTIGAHVVTAVATLLLVLALFGNHLRARRNAPVAQVPGPREAATAYRLPDTVPPPIPDEVLRRVDADEQVNIRVYESVNKSVVNITTVSEGGLFGDETSTGTGSGFVIDQDEHILTNYHVVEGGPPTTGASR